MIKFLNKKTFYSLVRVKREGFTLIEIIVVISIIVLISIVSFYNFRAGRSESRLTQAAQKLALDLRRAQIMTMSSIVFNNQIPAGYGIYVPNANSTNYILFADLNNDKIYNIGEDVELIALDSNILIFSSSRGFPLNITFTAPEPKITINNNPAFNDVTVSVQLEGKTKNIFVNIFGYVNVE